MNAFECLKVRVGLICSILILSSIAVSTAQAKEVVIPFIKDKYWKENISLEAFRSNPREYFRSEAAFNLLAGYVESEIGKPLTNAEFIALMNDSSQTRVRDCPVTETVRVGGLEGSQFFWFSRKCRPGEEIVQIRLHNRWLDVFSLSCLNAKEDITPVPAPILTPALVAASVPESLSEKECRFVDEEVTQQAGLSVFISPLIGDCNCFAPGVFASIQPSIQTSSKLICD